MNSFTGSTTVLELDLICRTCLSLNDSNRMKSLFMDDGYDICNMLHSCSGLNVHILDGFPKHICSDCLKKLQISYEFRRQCEISHNVLVNYMETKINRDSEKESRTDTKLENCFEIYNCSLCLNQYTMLVHLQDHVMSDHPDMTNRTNLEDANLFKTNRNAGELIEENNSPNTIDCMVDCVEGKYSISEPDVFAIHFKEKNNAQIPTDSRNHKTDLERANLHNTNGNKREVFKIDKPTVICSIMDCDEEKYKISEPDISTINLRKAYNLLDGVDEDSSNESDSSLITVLLIYDDIDDPISDCKENKALERKTKSSDNDSEQNEFFPFTDQPVLLKTEICEICQMAFTSSRNLQNHMILKHQPNVLSFCKLCNLTFEKKFNYCEHMKTQHKKDVNIKPYQCNKCDKAFKRKAHLRSHCERRHVEYFIKSEICKICPQAFITPNELQLHMKIKHRKFTNLCAM